MTVRDRTTATVHPRHSTAGRYFNNPSDIQKNPFRRTIPKQFLNCLWGNIAQHLQLLKSQYLIEEELQQKLQYDMLEIIRIELLENTEHLETDMMLINYQEKTELVENCHFLNVVLACFTTAHAHLHMYGALQLLGERVLYFDTASIIYQHYDIQFNPTIINNLGGLTDELGGYHIVKYMSGVPKKYAYETMRPGVGHP
jgi:hypothetical protein